MESEETGLLFIRKIDGDGCSLGNFWAEEIPQKSKKHQFSPQILFQKNISLLLHVNLQLLKRK